MCSAVVAATGAAREDRRLRVALKMGGVALRVALRDGFGREGEDVGEGDSVLDDILKGPALL